MCKWISVDDSLPEPLDDVWIRIEYDDGEIVYSNGWMAYAGHDNENWCFDGDGHCVDYLDYTVTHYAEIERMEETTNA